MVRQPPIRIGNRTSQIETAPFPPDRPGTRRLRRLPALPSPRSGPPGEASSSENCLILFHLSHSIAGQRLWAGRSCDVIGQNCYTVKRKWDGMGRLIRGRQGGLWGWGGCQHRCTLAHVYALVKGEGRTEMTGCQPRTEVFGLMLKAGASGVQVDSQDVFNLFRPAPATGCVGCAIRKSHAPCIYPHPM